MTERKLASIQKIDALIPIENKDNIEAAHIQGWNVIVKKGEFKPGDICVYCEIDSVLPDKSEFEFLRPKHFRIKTWKMNGVIYQGIVFPLKVLGDEISSGMLRDHSSGKSDLIGLDVTHMMGVTKYEPPISPQLMGKIKGSFPAFIPKTDEIRLQSVIRVLDEIRGRDCYTTEKEDGTSYTGFHIVKTTDKDGIIGLDSDIGVCSRNLELNEDDSVYWKISKQYNIPERLKKFYKDTGRNIAIQGEITGDGINKNRLGLPRNIQQLHLFSIYDIDKMCYVGLSEFVYISQALGLPTVRIIYEGKFEFTLEELLEMSKGKYPGTKNNREGIVVRTRDETKSFILQGRMSFKVINNDYLLKEEE